MIAVAGGILLAGAIVYTSCWLIERGGPLMFWCVAVVVAILLAAFA